MTKLASKLPEGGHGLSTISHRLVASPHEKHVVIGVVDCSQVTTDHDNGSVEPTARVRRLEVIADAGDLDTAEQLLRRALDMRLGSTVLPLVIEDDIREAFVEAIGRLDPDEGYTVDGEVVPIDREIRDALDAVKRLGYGRVARILSIALGNVDDALAAAKVDDAPTLPSGDVDDLVVDVARLVVETQHGSTAMVQRKLKVGYGRAASIMARLEEFGVVGPSQNGQPREVLVSVDTLPSVLTGIATGRE